MLWYAREKTILGSRSQHQVYSPGQGLPDPPFKADLPRGTASQAPNTGQSLPSALPGDRDDQRGPQRPGLCASLDRLQYYP